MIDHVTWPGDRVQQLYGHRRVSGRAGGGGGGADTGGGRRSKEVERLTGAGLGDRTLDEVDDAGR